MCLNKKTKTAEKTTAFGFTLIELLVVVAIIGILASVVVIALSPSREKGKVAAVVSQVREVQKSIYLYLLDTGEYPPTCLAGYSCSTDADDPFLRSLGVPGWNGPYLGLYNLSHPWKGQIGFENGDSTNPLDWDGDGTYDYCIFLNDDRPGTSASDNGGQVPVSALEQIDAILDDGDLSTGNARGNEGGWPSILPSYQTTSLGEMCIKISL